MCAVWYGIYHESNDMHACISNTLMHDEQLIVCCRFWITRRKTAARLHLMAWSMASSTWAMACFSHTNCSFSIWGKLAETRWLSRDFSTLGLADGRTHLHWQMVCVSNTCKHTHMHTYIHIYMYTYTHTHTYIHTYIHTCIHTYILTIHTCMHTHIHTYIHTDRHT